MTALIPICTGASLLAYALGTAMYLGHLADRRFGAVHGGLSLLGAGWLAHLLALATWSLAAGRLPMGSIAETLGLYAWLLATAAILGHWLLAQPAYASLLAPLALTAAALGAALERGRTELPPILASEWLPLHVLTSFAAYAALTLAAVAALLYLVGLRRLKGKSLAALDPLIPPLAVTEWLIGRLVAIGLPLLTLAIGTGALWADGAWGAAWSWDPKETVALATWLLWAACVWARYTGWRGRRAAWLVVAGFVATVTLFVGVGYLAPGRHDFGL